MYIQIKTGYDWLLHISNRNHLPLGYLKKNSMNQKWKRVFFFQGRVYSKFPDWRR